MEKNMPKLRFPEFDGEWEMKRIDEVAPLQRGFDLPVDNIIKGEFPVVFSNGILKQHNEFKVKAPGVVTGRSGTIGKVTYVEADFWPHNTSLWVTNFKGNLPLFIYYFYFRYNLERFGTGSGVPTLNRNDIHLQKEYFPALSEQTKIANFLTAVDDKLTQLKKKKSLLEQYKKGVMQKLFNCELRFKNDVGEDFPEWEEKKLGEVATFLNGKAYQQKELLDSGKYPVLRVGNFFSNNSWYYSDLELEENKYCDKGDLLYAWSASFGPKIWDGEKCVYHYHIWKVLPHKNISPKYLFYILDEQTLKIKTNSSNGFALIHITKGTIESWQVLVPSLSEQTKIANFLSAIDEKISHFGVQIEKMEGWKKGLLQGMFV